MATATLEDIHYVITIAGTYYTNEAKGENTHSYEVDVPMTQEQLNDQKVSALSLFRHNYADRMMKTKYPAYSGLCTHEIRKVQCSDPARLLENTALMNSLQLARYIKSHGLPIKTELYEDAGSLRAAIADYHKDNEGFVKSQKITESRKGPHLKRQSAADRMMEQYGDAFIKGAVKPIASTRKKQVEPDDDIDGV
jgi:hypothetical protein